MTFTGFERHYGTDGPDTFIGSNGDDWVKGGKGRDTVDGKAGVDVCRNFETVINCETVS
jgi:Ca2+-binding RTX toxin-like protein